MCSPFSEMIIFHVGITPYFPRVEKYFHYERYPSLDWFMVLKATFNNISVLSWRSVLLVG